MQDGLKNIISGIGAFAETNLIQTTLRYLRASKTASGKIEKRELFNKEDEKQLLIRYVDENRLWIESIDLEKYIAEGAEQKVFLDVDNKHVLKINDTIFYEFWEDYFISLTIHNYLFPATAYQLLGFYFKDNILYAVVKQPFIICTEPTDLEKLRAFLEANGFSCQRNNDFINKEMGIILEDLHDENVLTNSGVFFFIDTVIYLLK